MEELKSIFGEGSLSYDEFTQKVEEAGDTIKLANLKSGKYVDVDKLNKYEKDAENWHTKYDALVESTKDYNDVKSKYETLQNDYSSLQSKYDETEKRGLLNDANVKSKFAKFVMSEVSALTSEDKDFKTALGEYLKENSEFVENPKGNFVDLENGNSQPKSNNSIMNNLIRRK